MDNSLKNKYPFRLGTTSFIHPADYVTNVRQLAPCLDEIELLMFESRQLPSVHDIDELNTLAASHTATYNVHLPTDVDLASPSPDGRQHAIDAIAATIERMAPLRPTTYTLHLSFNPDHPSEGIKPWQKRAKESMARLLKVSCIPSRLFSIETLDFSPGMLQPIVEDLDLSVCVDVGHTIRFGFDLHDVLDTFSPRITILHLHGIANGKDHRSIRHLTPAQRSIIAPFLKRYRESVSIEVFSLNHLLDSMAVFPLLINNHNADPS